MTQTRNRNDVRDVEVQLRILFRRAGRRLAYARTIRLACTSSLCSLVAGSVILAASLFFPIPRFYSLCPLLLLPIVAIVSLFWLDDPAKAAQEMDRRLELEERAITSYEIISGKLTTGFRDMLLNDTWQRLSECDLNRQIPVRLPVRSVFLIPLLLLFIAGFYLIPQFAAEKELSPDRSAISEIAAELEIVADNSKTRDSREKLNRVIKVMKRGDIGRSDVLEELTKLESETREQHQIAEKANETLREISNVIRSSLPFSTESIKRSSELIERVAGELERGEIPPESLKAIEAGLRKLFEVLGELDGEIADSLAEASRTPLSADSLRKLADALKSFEAQVDDLELLRMMLAKIRRGESMLSMVGMTDVSDGTGGAADGSPGSSSGDAFSDSDRNRPNLAGQREFRFTADGANTQPAETSDYVVGDYDATSSLPESEIIANAREVAEEQLNNGVIPPVYRETIKRYFLSLSGETDE